jgi:hypothetical protein
MTEEKNCLILKYNTTYGKGQYTQDYEKCYVLNELEAIEFNLSPINDINVSYEVCAEDPFSAYASLYFIEKITKSTYTELKNLYMVDDEIEIIEIIEFKKNHKNSNKFI